MIKKTFFVFILLSTLYTARCFSQDSTVAGQAAITQTGDTTQYATIYVHRPRNYVGSRIGYDVHLNDAVLCKIKNNTKYAVRVFKEGPAELWAKTEQKRSVKVDIKFGQSYYLKCGITTGVFAGRPELNLVYPEQGKLDYDNLDAKNTKKKKGEE